MNDDRLGMSGKHGREIIMVASNYTDNLPLNLGDGLRLRRSQKEDQPALAQFNAMIHSDEGPNKPDDRLHAWTSDLLVKSHPTFKPDKFTIVDEVATGRIISSMNLIPQTWTYAGIPFKVGRPELVGTLPEYRNRGLVRKQFELIHHWSARAGEMLQVITGIPYYYRLFGYEMALNLGGGRVGYPRYIPGLKDGDTEPYLLRQPTEADIPFLSRLYQVGCQRSLIACEWDDDLWRYEMSGKSNRNVNRSEIRLIETADGVPCGFITHPIDTWGDMLVVQRYELLPEFPWMKVTPSILRYIENTYQQLTEHLPESKPFGRFGFWLGEDHPVYHVMPDSLPFTRKPYAWYLRLSDIPAFLRLITPVLEKRLANSPLAGYSGEVRLTFYRDGVRLQLEGGKLIVIEAWKPTPVSHSGEAAFPPHTFLQLLFGYRSIDKIKSSFADCWTSKDEIHALLDALFPWHPSDVWPVS
jgi:hypothetical protein